MTHDTNSSLLRTSGLLSQWALRSQALFLSVVGVSLAACSGVDEPNRPAETVREVMQPLQVTDPTVALPILLPESTDPAFEGLDPPDDAPTRGMWSPVFDWPLNGLHSVLLPNGRVLTYGTPSGNPATQDGRTFDVWNPSQGFGATGHHTDFDAQRVNSFCSSAAFTAEGSLLISGGNSPLDSSFFSPETSNVETSTFKLASERWYGSMITLPDGRFIMLGGSGPYEALRAYKDPAQAINAGSVSMTPEIYEPGTGFRSLFGAYSREAFGPDHHRYWYPRAWVAPSGKVFGISSEKMWTLDYSGDGSVQVEGDFKTGADPETRPNIGPTSTAVMFAPGRILQVGGNGYHDGHATPSSNLATIIDINGAGPEVTETNPMHFARQWANATVLPDGRVVVTGGTRYANNGGDDAVYAAELWDPEDGTWTVGASAAVIRVYHSAAILMPNGTVLSTGGGAPGPVNNLSAEVYYPPYLFRPTTSGGAELAPRPRAVAVSTVSPDYGEVLNIDLAGSATIEEAVLIATSSATHSFNTSQRRLELPFLQEGGRVAVRMPASGTEAPPGFYGLLFRDADGVPSSAIIISLGESMAAPPLAVTLPNGSEISLLSVNNPDHAIGADEDGLGVLEFLGDAPTEADLLSARFIPRDGLGDSNCVSFEAVASPGKWLRQADFRLRLGTDDGSDEFESDATFCPEQGLSGSGITFRSKSFPDRVIRHRDLELWLDPVSTEQDFEADASFVLRSSPLPEIPSVDAPIAAVGAEVTYSPLPIPGAMYSWDFGDGTEKTTESASPNASHVFATPGLYLVTLTVRLADGRRVTKTFIQAVNDPPPSGTSRSSSLMAISSGPDGDRLWVVNPDNDSTTVFALDSLTQIAEVPVGGAPRSIAISGDGDAWITSRDEGAISIIDAHDLSVRATVPLPSASRPYGLVFSTDFEAAYVTLDGLGKIAQLKAKTGELLETADVGSTPRGLALTGDGSRLLVSRFISPPVPGESTATPLTDLAKAELRVIDVPSMNALRVVTLGHNDEPDGSVQGRGVPNYVGAPVVSPDGLTAWIPSKQDNVARGSLRDGQPLNFQNTVRAVTSRVDLLSESEAPGSRIDLDNAGLASAAAMHPSGIYLFVALETSREVAVVNALLGTELFRIDVGRAPRALALSGDGTRLFVKNFMDRSVSVVDLSPLVEHGEFDSELLATLPTVRSERLSPEVLFGKQLFYDASDTRLARDGYLSCAVCHAEGGHDGRVWDLTGQGEGLRNTISLLGFSRRQGPLHWSANFDEVQDFETQIRDLAEGSGLLSDAQYELGTVRDPLGDPKAGLSPDLDALAAYVNSLEEVPPSPWRDGDQLTKLGKAGRKAFARRGCNECHYGATFSDEEQSGLKDVGTLTAASGKRLSGPLVGLDVPSLLGAWSSAPYLHDGSAPTLEDAISSHEGVLLNDKELTQIASFVKQIDGREPGLPKLGCFDGAQNESETDVDCGGSCAACSIGSSCVAPSDCASNLCTEGVCSTETDEPGDKPPSDEPGDKPPSDEPGSPSGGSGNSSEEGMGGDSGAHSHPAPHEEGADLVESASCNYGPGRPSPNAWLPILTGMLLAFGRRRRRSFRSAPSE